MFNKKIYIYGAGVYGNILFDLLVNAGAKVTGFVQTDQPEMAQVKGIPVMKLAELAGSIHEEIIILIAIKNPRMVLEMRSNIQKLMINAIVYDCAEFIDSNRRYKDISNLKSDSTNRKKCIVCGCPMDLFLPIGTEEEIFMHHHIIGGGIRPQAICPICRSTDRSRWVYHVLKTKTDITTASGRALHFAPEEVITNLLLSNERLDYYSGDIVPRKALHIIDITDIPFADKCFDYVICNHVLEHIPDVDKAVAEIRRVLKDDGSFIFSFPICTDMLTLENRDIQSPEERLRHYGQKDHVRLYGNDFAQIYENYGFVLDIYRPQDELTEKEVEEYGVIKDDVLIVAHKK